MKKCFILVPSLGIGGQEKIALNTYLCLKHNYDVKVIVFQSRDREYESDFEVVNINCPATEQKLSKVLMQIKRAIIVAKLRKTEKPDIVYSFGLTANITNILSGFLSQGKCIVSIHGYAGLKKTIINSFVFKAACRVICISQEMLVKYNELFPKNNNGVVVENGYCIDEIIRGDELCYKLNRSNNIVAMGRLTPVKRYDLLLRAFKEIKKKFDDAILTIIGDGELKDELIKLSDELKIRQSVRFLGYLENPYTELKKQDVFVLCSRNEGFPNSLIEAMACRLAIVSVDCSSGPREIISSYFSKEQIKGIEYKKFGVLVENSNDNERLVNLLSQAVCFVLSNIEIKKKYQYIGLERAINFSLSVYCDKIEKMFDEVIHS